MEYTKEAGAEPLPGYKLIEPLGSGGFGEVWKCEVSGGLFKAIKFVHGNLNGLDPENTAKQELQALERVKAIRHPFVLSLERVEILQGELVMVMELADKSLEDRLRECREEGLAGIPRDELLPLLHDAAEALDLLNFQHDLQHLDIKPANLFLVGSHVKLADFGLVQSLEELSVVDADQPRAGMTPLYSPPEMLQGKGSRHCDQYSLAIVYQQLLTATLPFDGKNSRQLMMKHLMEEPNLESLSDEDRPIVAKALAKNPDERHSSCQAFIQALIMGGNGELRNGGTDLGKTTRYLRLPPKELLSGAKQKTQPLTPIQNSPAAFNSELRETRELQLPGGINSTPHATMPLGGYKEPARQSNGLFGGNSSSRLPPNLPGYELLDCVHSGMLGDAWKVRSGDGRQLLARTFPEVAGVSDAVKHYLETLRQVDHPSLPNHELHEVDGRPILVTSYHHPTLMDRFRTCVAQGDVGIGRRELLHCVASAARHLLKLASDFQFPHLHLNPHSILVEENKVLFLDFGLATIFRTAIGGPLAGLNARYAPPEFLVEQFDASSDQYSMALMYVELLTGFHPRPKPLTVKTRYGTKLDLTFLPSRDQRAVQRALQSDPAKRFETIVQFMEALGVRFRTGEHNNEPIKLLPVAAIYELHGMAMARAVQQIDPTELLEEYLFRAVGVRSFHSSKSCHYVERTDHSLETQIAIRLPEGMLREKLVEFAAKWNARTDNPGRSCFIFRTESAKGMWKRLLSGEQGLEVRLDAENSIRSPTVYAGARIRIQGYGADKASALQQLKTRGPELMESLCTFLKAGRDQREQTRVPFQRKVLVYPLMANQQMGPAIEGIGKNISTGGLGVLVPEKPTADQVYVQLEQAPETEPLAVLMHIVRTKPPIDGLYELGLALGTMPSASDSENQNSEASDAVLVV